MTTTDPTADAVRPLTDDDIGAIYAVINAAAGQYSGVIPEAADTTPYMPVGELREALTAMTFHGIDRQALVGVVGVEEKADVTLIRHCYVRPTHQRDGIGTRLVESAIDRADAPTVLVGTWAAAEWAVEFYTSQGFDCLGTATDLLATYWSIPDHQREASVVLRYEQRP